MKWNLDRWSFHYPGEAMGRQRAARPAFLVTTEQRIWLDMDGVPFGAVPLTAFEGLETTEPVTLLARVRKEASPPWAVRLFSGPVEVMPLGRFLISWRAFRGMMKILGRGGTLAAYVPGVVSLLPIVLWLALGRPVAVAVVGDPAAVLQSGAVGGARGLLARLTMPRLQRWACDRSYAARYVTDDALQRLYPPGRRTKSFALSDVCIARVDRPRRHPGGSRPLRLVTVGSLVRRYKGVEDLLEALTICWDRGLSLELTVVGDGAQRPAFEAQAKACGQRVRFAGHLSRGAVQEELQKADLFVLASWTEGQPRALLEAMASGLPAVATRVGGVPELLEPECLVLPRSPAALAEALIRVAGDPELFDRLAFVNARRAAELLPGQLEPQHKLWLNTVRTR
jgi:phosphatidylinositol alpha-1,6-mannosyltransferase